MRSTYLRSGHTKSCMTAIRECPTCGETQHLELYGFQGALFVHSKTGQMPCKLIKEKQDNDADKQRNEEDSETMV